MTENDLVTIGELAAVLDVPESDLTAGPFVEVGESPIRLRLAFATAILAMLGESEALPPVLAARVAMEAAERAQLGGSRSLLVAWKGAKPSWAWFDGPATHPPIDAREGFGSPLRRPMVLLPADEMFGDLALAILAHRERGAGASAH